jgi:hypothetical protein
MQLAVASGQSIRFSLVDISSTISSDNKFTGAAVTSNGLVIFAPDMADGVGVFDPSRSDEHFQARRHQQHHLHG